MERVPARFTSSRMALDLEKRLVRGRVVRVTEALITFDILGSFPHGRLARVDKDDLPEGREFADYPVGTEAEIFLIQPVKEEPSLWRASLRWGERERNPWFVDCPSVQQEVRGVVIDYIEDYAAVVRLNSGMEVMLHRNNLPHGGYEPIANLLDLGDQVAGVVLHVDKPRLDVRIAVPELLARRKAAELARRRTEPLPEEATEAVLEPPTPIPAPTLTEAIRALFIDDDEPFCKTLHVWLKRTGAQVTYVSKPERLSQLNLKEFTHILVDFNLENPGLEKQARAILEASQGQVALLSANWKEAQQEAKRRGVPFFPKPLALAQLIPWLREGKLPDLDQLRREDGINPFWRGSRSEQAILRKGDQLLEDLCQQGQCLGALWVVQERPGVYSLRAHHGLDESGLESFVLQIGNSPLARVLETGVPLEVHVAKSGPLRQVAPMGANHLWIFPVEVMGVQDRVLAFFRNTPFDHTSREWLSSQKPRMADLAERLILIQHMQETEAFAALGRVQSGLLHEIRNHASPLKMVTEELRRLLSLPVLSPDAPYIREMLDDVVKAAESLVRLTQSDLGMIQKERVETMGINRIVRRIVRLFRPQINKSKIRLEFHPAPFEITVSLPPAVVEQPLINLLDNALYHIGERTWGRVVVRVSLDWNTIERPIRIEVEDNGFGMKAQSRDQLFLPRSTAKGVQGVGMGLFVSRNLLRSVGGELELAESMRWVGSRFIIHLPAKIGTPAEISP